MCPGADFLNKSVQPPSRSLNMEKAHSCLLRTFTIALQIITDMQAISRRTACCSEGFLKHTRLRF
jgi:hypothetical protein